MGAIVTIKYKDVAMDYIFDVANDGVEFKKDVMKGWKKNGIKRKASIKKTKDIKPKPPERRHYEEF